METFINHLYYVRHHFSTAKVTTRTMGSYLDAFYLNVSNGINEKSMRNTHQQHNATPLSIMAYAKFYSRTYLVHMIK